jgi:hypothetical protein
LGITPGDKGGGSYGKEGMRGKLERLIEVAVLD